MSIGPDSTGGMKHPTLRSLKSLLLSSSVVCLSSLGLLGVPACDLRPDGLEFRSFANPFEVYDVLENFTATPDAGPVAIVDAEAAIQTLDTAALIYAMNDEYSDDPTPAAYMADIAELFPNDPEIVTAYQAMYQATTVEQRRAIMFGLLAHPDYHLAPAIFRGTVSVMALAGASETQMQQAFATASGGRINLAFAAAGECDGVVSVQQVAAVAGKTAVAVTIYGNVNNVSSESLAPLQSCAASGDDGGGDGGPTGDPTGDTTAGSTTAGSTTANTTTESSTTVNTTVNTTINTTTTGGGGGGNFDLLELLWDMTQGAAAGATLGALGGGHGAAIGAGVGAAAGAAYYFGSGFMADPSCDATPWILC
jgi:hypothetical protein